MTNHFAAPPRSVDRAFMLLCAALLAGIAEAVLRDGIDFPSPAPRLVIYAVVAAVMMQMRAGRRWARTTLTLGLGTVGLASLLVEPAAALLSANPPDGPLTGQALAIGTARAVHVIAVIGALVLMYRLDARTYFTAPDRARFTRSGPGKARTVSG